MLNKVMLIGNLGKDPELRYTQKGTAVATFPLATSKHWTDKDGNKQEKTEWHHIVVWQKLAETCDEYLKKGSKIYIEGELQTRKWQDQDGNDRYSTEIVAGIMKMLTPRSGTENAEGEKTPQYKEQPAPPLTDREDVPF